MTVEQYNAMMNGHFSVIKESAIAAEAVREAELSAIDDYFNNLRDPKSE